jgi:hypothetical protein
MAEKQSSSTDLLSALTKGKDIFNLWQTYNAANTMATAGASQGMLYPGGISGPVPSAFSGGAAAIAAAPFMALAGFIAPKLIQGLFGDKPKIGFSGVNPTYTYDSGLKKYYGREEGHTQTKILEPSSKKYAYHISVEDTGRDGEIGQALVNYFDSMFDQMAAQGIPVDELLTRNSAFAFGGRMDKGMTPEKMVAAMQEHFAPDIEAYARGEKPPEREIMVHTINPRTAGLSGRDAYDAGIRYDDYVVKIGEKGVNLKDKIITIGPNDPRAKLIKAATGSGNRRDDNTAGATLLPGFTYKIDMTGYTGRDQQMSDFSTLEYTVPGGEQTEQAQEAQTGQTNSGGNNMAINPNDPYDTASNSGAGRSLTFDKDLYLQNKLAEWKVNHPDAPAKTVDDIAANIRALYPDADNPYEQHFKDYGRAEGVIPFEGVTDLRKITTSDNGDYRYVSPSLRDDLQFEDIDRPEERPGQEDLLNDLVRQAQDISGQSISATVGGQPITVMPRSNQDQLNNIMGYLFTDQKMTELEHQFDQQHNTEREKFISSLMQDERRIDELSRQFNLGFAEDQRQFDTQLSEGVRQFNRADELAQPSSVDKISQLLGLGADAINIWDTVDSLVDTDLTKALVDKIPFL